MTRRLIYLFFFLSGAAALVYQVVWVRSLTLVFGGSHHAVTAVLAIFMAGLALGGYLSGRIVDRVPRALGLYGVLELGIAGSALGFMGLMAIYPALYVPLARGRDDATAYLLVLRAAFSVVALIVPTTLMGATLPVLSRFVSRRPETLGRSLAWLYGLNTLGAVAGALLAGFVLLRLYSVSATTLLAITTNTVVGLLSLALQARMAPDAPGRAPVAPPSPVPTAGLARRLVLAGIAVSGFCALGYEVLWTRILTLAVGASVYGFTLMLVAFLAGIALGSKAYGAVLWLSRGAAMAPARAVAWFGVVQILIGGTALLVTLFLRDVPVNAIRLQELFPAVGSFGARVWTSFALAFGYMLVPAFLMGLAFPLAGQIHARHRGAVGRAVGEVLASNTIGAIAGAAVSGFALLHLFGIERSLQMLVTINLGMGLVVLAGARGSVRGPAAAAAVTAGALVFLALNPGGLRLWDPKYFAIYRSNQPDAFRIPALVREAIENTEVLYYAEGAEAIVSVIQVRGGEPAFVTNGRVEASSTRKERQCQYTLGHLPVLLARAPRRVLVVGLGSGMTLGATSIHPSVEQVTLVEIEPKVIGVARTFAAFNHRVLDSPKLRIVFNDGRNFLLTTAEKFDVITADPVHPWFRGAGYLYTREYFRLAAEHLNPGGVVAQWLPIYELTPHDLRSIVRTFRTQFKHTLLWLTHYDAELIGSNDPIVIDEAELARRMATPAVAADLEQVMMGSPTDLLSYFVMGSAGMARFAEGGTLNTDDRLYLEFSAPFSIATPEVMEANARAITAHRESLLPYLVAAADPAAREAQRRRRELQRDAGGVTDPALALFLGGKTSHPAFGFALASLEQHYPWYAPGRFLRAEHEAALALDPRPLRSLTLELADASGRRKVVEITAVLVPISGRRAAVMFVDNKSRVVYGQRYVDDYASGEKVREVVEDVMKAVDLVYRTNAERAGAGRLLPDAETTIADIRDAIDAIVGDGGA